MVCPAIRNDVAAVSGRAFGREVDPRKGLRPVLERACKIGRDFGGLNASRSRNAACPISFPACRRAGWVRRHGGENGGIGSDDARVRRRESLQGRRRRAFDSRLVARRSHAEGVARGGSAQGRPASGSGTLVPVLHARGRRSDSHEDLSATPSAVAEPGSGA